MMSKISFIQGILPDFQDKIHIETNSSIFMWLELSDDGSDSLMKFRMFGAS